MILEIIIGILAFLFVWNVIFRSKNFPPGPWGLPVVGHIPIIGSAPHKTFLQWKNKYGPIIGVKMGSYRCVAVSDAKILREIFNNPVFSGRPMVRTMADRSGGAPKGILFTEGTEWNEQRRFTLHYLRDFGFGTKSMEARIMEEIIQLTENISKVVDRPVGLKHKFNAAVVNALWSIMYGERFEHDDPDFTMAVDRITNSITESNITANLVVFMPWIADYFPKVSGYTKMMEDFPPVLDFLRDKINRHNEGHEPGQPRDFLDAYHDEMAKATNKLSSFHPERDTLLYTLMDLFVAGAESTATTLSWLYVYMINFQDKQEKLYEEIMNVIGPNRLPSLADRPSMSYTEAIISETLRHSSLAPFGLFHKALEDTTLQGYNIPAGTVIIPNHYGAHNDPETWGDPRNFRPERFLDAHGKFKKNENLIPFASGKRSCLGESLARDELFLFSTSLFQKFQACPASKLPSLEGVVSGLITPEPFEVVFKLRNA